MIVDADCHISPQSGHLDITVEDLVPMMDANSVEKALCWLKPPYTRHIEDSNRAVYEAVQRYPDRIMGFGWANPRLGLDSAFESVERCLSEYGFPGVKLMAFADNGSRHGDALVVVNGGGEPEPLQIGVSAAGGAFYAYRTSPSERCAEVGEFAPQAGTMTYEAPPESVTTFLTRPQP